MIKKPDDSFSNADDFYEYGKKCIDDIDMNKHCDKCYQRNKKEEKPKLVECFYTLYAKGIHTGYTKESVENVLTFVVNDLQEIRALTNEQEKEFRIAKLQLFIEERLK